MLWLAVAAMVLAAVLLVAQALMRSPTGGRSTIESVAVLPLLDLSGDPAQAYFADGMTEALITDLSKVGRLRVISRTSVMRFKGSDRPLPEIARELGVDAVVEGSVLREDDRVRITAQLIDAATDRHLWADSFDRDLTSVLALQSDVARAIAKGVAIELSPLADERLTIAREVDPEVYELYLRGRFELGRRTPEGFENGLALLHQAVAADPTEPLAYAALADGYVMLGHSSASHREYFQRAKAAAQRALELDPQQAQAQSVMADVLLYSEWDWAGAEAAFQRAFELDPNLPWAHFHYSWFLALQGRLEEAIVEHERAEALDPLEPVHTAFTGWLYLYEHRFDKALRKAQLALEIDPNSPDSHFIAAEAYAAQGLYDEAISSARRATSGDPGLRFAEARALAAAGRDDEARAILAELESREWSLWDGMAIPSVYVALGDFDGAFRGLERAYEMRSPWLPWIGVEYLYQPLRGEERLDDLLRRMGSPEV